MTDQSSPVEALHDALDAVPFSIHGREADWVDGGGEVIAEALVAAGWTPPGVPVRDHASAEQARRDDLARDVARLWRVHCTGTPPFRHLTVGLADALDRLAAAYLPDGPREVPRG